MSRLTDARTLADSMVDMAEGNPGACTVLGRLYQEKGPDGVVMMSWLDGLELYGADIWIAYKDVCHEELDVLCDMLRHHRHALKAGVLKAVAR